MTKKLGPKGNPMGRKAGVPYEPSNKSVAWVMGEFLSLVLGVKKSSIQAYFSRNKKKLSSFEDCKEFLFQKLKKEK